MQVNISLPPPVSTTNADPSTYTRRPVQETEHEQRLQQKQLDKEKSEALDGNLHIPILSALHESLGAARTESTYVTDRLAGEPKHGPVTNIPAPTAPAPIFGAQSSNDVNNSHNGMNGSGKFQTDTAGNGPPTTDPADGAFDALAALEGTAGSR